MGFSRQEYWRGFPRPPPGDLPDPGIKLTSLMSSTLASGFFTTSVTWKAHRLLGTNPITKQKYIIEKLSLEVSLFFYHWTEKFCIILKEKENNTVLYMFFF